VQVDDSQYSRKHIRWYQNVQKMIVSSSRIKVPRIDSRLSKSSTVDAVKFILVVYLLVYTGVMRWNTAGESESKSREVGEDIVRVDDEAGPFHPKSRFRLISAGFQITDNRQLR
jgi:hypothetical protein